MIVSWKKIGPSLDESLRQVELPGTLVFHRSFMHSFMYTLHCNLNVQSISSLFLCPNQMPALS